MDYPDVVVSMRGIQGIATIGGSKNFYFHIGDGKRERPYLAGVPWGNEFKTVKELVDRMVEIYMEEYHDNS